MNAAPLSNKLGSLRIQGGIMTDLEQEEFDKVCDARNAALALCQKLTQQNYWFREFHRKALLKEEAIQRLRDRKPMGHGGWG